jgi:TonB family protein
MLSPLSGTTVVLRAQTRDAEITYPPTGETHVVLIVPVADDAVSIDVASQSAYGSTVACEPSVAIPQADPQAVAGGIALGPVSAVPHAAPPCETPFVAASGPATLSAPAPQIGALQGIAGAVRVTVMVDASGNAVGAAIVASQNAMLKRKRALAAARAASYQPATLACQPGRGETTVTVFVR